MNAEILELRSELSQIRAELAAAQQTIRRLEKRSADPSRAVQLGGFVVVTTLALWGFSAAPAPSKFKAPFEVVDSFGKKILRVGDVGRVGEHVTRGIMLYDYAEKLVGFMSSSSPGGAMIKVMSADNPETRVSIGAFENNLGVLVAEGSVTGNLAWIGKNEAGGGLVELYTGGDKRIALHTSEGRGQINVVNSGGKACVFLGESEKIAGAGKLTLGNSAGSEIVGAGVTPSGMGLVRAFPLTGRSPIPVPNFIKGGKGSE